MARAAKKPVKAKKPTTKKPVKKTASPARKSAKAVKRSLAELVAAVGDATDWDELTEALRAIAEVGTPEAHAAVLDLAMNPPNHPCGEDVAIIAVDVLGIAYKEHPAIHDWLLDTCEAMIEHPRCCEPLIVLGNAAGYNPDTLKDRRLCALLRRAISDPNLVEVRSQAIAVMLKYQDPESLPLAVAALDRMGPEDWGELDNIAAYMYSTRQVDADGLAKLRAARSRLEPPAAGYYTQLDRYIERLANFV